MSAPDRSLGQGSEAKVDPFETNVEGPVEANFQLDGIFGADPDGLIWKDLKEPVFISQGEVVGDDPLPTDGKDFLEPMMAEKRPVDIDGAPGLDGAACVVVGDVDPAEEFIGLGDGRYSGESKLFDQAVLVGQETSLDTSFGLGAQGEDHLDVQLAHGAGELGHGLRVPKVFIDGSLAIDLVDGVPVNVEGGGTTMEVQVGLDGGQEVEGVLHGDEHPEQDAACGVVDEDQEGAPGASALEPIVVAPIQLNQLPDRSPALPPSAMEFPLRPGVPQSDSDHSLTENGGRQEDLVELFELFIGERRAEV